MNCFSPNGQTLTPNPSPKREGNKCAFTLAEVLITLVIIGIIAAITVPSLMNKTNKQEYVSKLKKAYSALSQATNLIIAEEGSPRGDKDGWASSSENVYNLFKKHLINAKECGQNTGCFSQRNIKWLNNGQETWNRDGSDFYKLILSDGIQVNIHKDWIFTDCDYSTYGSSNICVLIQLDINGEKKPNQLGYDVYAFVIKENGLYPIGCDYDSCVGTIGWGCACKVLREGAINY